MAFADFTEFLEPLVLPIRGKGYTIPPLSLEDGLKLSAFRDAEAEKPDMSHEEFNRLVLGGAYDEMVADGVRGDAIFRAVLTAWAEYIGGRVAAEIVWKTGGDPKAVKEQAEATVALSQAPQNRATRRKASKPSTSTGAAKKTR